MLYDRTCEAVVYMKNLYKMLRNADSNKLIAILGPVVRYLVDSDSFKLSKIAHLLV